MDRMDKKIKALKTASYALSASIVIFLLAMVVIAAKPYKAMAAGNMIPEEGLNLRSEIDWEHGVVTLKWDKSAYKGCTYWITKNPEWDYLTCETVKKTKKTSVMDEISDYHEKMNYAVHVIDKDGNVRLGDSTLVSFLPGDPDIYSIRTIKGTATVRWTKVPGADGYTIWYHAEGEKYKMYKSVKGTKCDVTDLPAGRYIFKVKAYRKFDKRKVYGKEDKMFTVMSPYKKEE